LGIPSIASDGIQEIAVTDDAVRIFASPSLDPCTLEHSESLG